MTSLFPLVCLKWGTKYPTKYVNTLHSAVKRNTKGDIEFHCITDDASGIDEDIICHPLPTEVKDLTGWWLKVSMFNPNFYSTLKGEVLYLDLDVVITADATPYHSIERTGDVLTMSDPRLEGMNSSVMRWNRDELAWVWDKFLTCEHKSKTKGRMKNYYELDGKDFRGDQDYLNYILPNIEYFPETWTLGYKAHGEEKVINQGQLKIVIFNGVPNPHQLVTRVPWIEECWK